MMVIPFELNAGGRGPVVFVLILERENVERMKLADPFDMRFSAYASHVPALVRQPIRNLDLVIAYEEDKEQVLDFRRRDDLAGLVAWLERGRTVYEGEPSPPKPFKE